MSRPLSLAALVFFAQVLTLAPQPAVAAPSFVQQRANEITAGTTNSVAFTTANTAGNLLVVYVVWDNAGPSTVVDSRGNTYTPAAAPQRWQNGVWSAQVFFAKNVIGGSNTVTASFATPITSFGIVYIHEYAGMDKVDPLDVTRSAVGTTSAMSSGSAMTTNANDLIFGAGASINNVNRAGTGFTTRSSAYGNRTEDRTVTAVGSYAATANQNSNSWVMHMVAFKAASSDTTAPSVPTGLTATPSSSAQVTLAWNASTDNVGVSGYQVFRNGSQVGTPTGTTFQDSGLTPSTSYSYSVSAVDAAGNVSAPSSVVNATTLPDTTAPSVPTGLSATPTSSSQIALSWSPSTDNVGVARYEVFRDGALVATPTATTFQDAALTASTTYTYTVSAVDAAGNASAQSSGVSATTLPSPDTTPPSVPTNVTATPFSSSQINLAWDPSTDNGTIAGYRVYRDGTLVGSPGTNLFQDTGLTASTTFSYTVAALDSAGNVSAPSTAVDATTMPAPPDNTPPTVALTSPPPGATLEGTVTLTASASDDVAVVGVQFLLDGANLGTEDTQAPYSSSWNTTTVPNGTHVLAARARDGASHLTTSTPVTVTVANPSAPPGLTAGYALDEGTGTTASDASGHDLTGTLANGASWMSGRFGTGVQLDGANDHVDLGNPNSLQFTGSMTVSAWIYPTTSPLDDGAIVSKRVAGGYQLDTTIDTGTRVVGFKLTNGSGSDMIRYGATTLQLNTWSFVTGVYDATAQTVDVYVNGQLDNGLLVGTVTASQQNSSGNVLMGQRSAGGFNFGGGIDNVRLYGRALSQSEIQTDMNAPLGSGGSSDPTPPTVSITAPASGAQVSGIVAASATADDNEGVVGVQFFVDGIASGPEDTVSPYAYTWDTRTASNGSHTLTARARDAAGNSTFSSGVTVNVANTDYFQNEILATNFNLPTAIKFRPDGTLLVAELAGRIRMVPAPYTTPGGTFLQIANIGSAGVQQGIYDFALDPNFQTNRYFYVFYTLGSPNVDRLSRFTANVTLDGTVANSEFVLYQDPQIANAEHHGGAIMFGNDGMLYFTTGEHFDAVAAEDLASPRGKIHRINFDGTAPTDNPFYDGNGPNWDSVWAYGLRNPFRAYYDTMTGRMFVGDVGGNDYATAVEEVELGARGANYGWPDNEGPCPAPVCTSPLYSYAHNGRDAAVTGGFVYHGTAFPAEYEGSYFFADYTQNWIRRLTIDGSGNLTGVFNFEPLNGAVDGPYGDIVYLVEGPDGALYYLDLGYSDISGSFGVSKLRRIKYVQSNQAPVALVSADPTSGPSPLSVNFSSAGTADPEGAALTYLWNFGDNVTSTEANPPHVYTQAGTYTARLTVSDGVNSTTSSPISISVGNRPVATITSPVDGTSFVAGTVITFAGDATDTEDGTLPATAFTWNVDFLHEGHVHPGTAISGAKSGSFVIPTSGHDFSGNTRYRITLTVVDSSGLIDTQTVTVWPTKVNLTFSSAPTGLTIYLDGIAKTAPFVYDTLAGFTHTIEARNQSANGNDYTFASWSDGGAQTHAVVVPASDTTYTATYTSAPISAGPISFVQLNYATPQTNQSSVTAGFNATQSAGNLNIVVIGWSDTTSSITTVTDTAGNVYVAAAPTTRSSSNSQAIYYAKNIAASAGNVVTVTFNVAASYVDLRIVEYSGIDAVNPFDKTASAVGSSSSASSGNVTTTAANELVFGAGTTSGAFSTAGSGFTTRVITIPDADIVEDRVVSTTGTYSATANQSGVWVMQVVTFKGAAQ